MNLAEVGESLWGADWQAEMTRQTGVGARTVSRMASGQRPVPPSLLVELAGMLRTEAGRLAIMAADLERRAAGQRISASRTNSAAGCGLIALPIARSAPTRPSTPCASGKPASGGRAAIPPGNPSAKR